MYSMLYRINSSASFCFALCVVVAFSFQLTGCSVSKRPGSIEAALEPQGSTPTLRTLAIPGLTLPDTVNPELLELDEVSFKGIPKALRALALSIAWMEKSQEQASIDSVASLASSLRAAQIALEVLLSTTQCNDDHSFDCKNLRTIYRKATHHIISILYARSWTPPSMSPSRYQFSEQSQRTITLLRDWEIALSSSAEQRDIDRPGLGMPLFGCRAFKKQSKICSPLTFVISFLNSLQSDTIVVDMSVVDAYQEEVHSINNTHIPLAANFSTPIEQLVAISAPSSFTLRCLSTPTSSTGLLLVLQQPEQSPKQFETFLQSVALNPSVRNSYTPCLAFVSDKLSIQATAKLARRITRAMHGLLRDTFSTKVSRLAIVNLVPETISLSTLLTTTLSNTNPKTWEIVSIGLPSYSPGQAHQYSAAEDTARRFSVNLFTVQNTCDLSCEDALASNNRDSLDPADGLGRSATIQHRDQEETLPQGSFTVSPTM